MKQIYHHYSQWEDYQNGMYETIDESEHPRHINLSVDLLSDPVECKTAMQNVIDNWPKSTEHNLTDKSINRRAWLGQAACCYVNKTPSEVTRQAWSNILPNNQGMANYIATQIIKQWERKHLIKLKREDVKAEYGLTLFDYA
jgi:hypothetical protein